MSHEVVEEMHLIFECELCHMSNKYSFVTKHDETITKEDELKKVLESVPCRHCRFERLKFREKRTIARLRER